MARGGQAVNGSRPVKARAFVAAATRINLRDRIEAKRQGAKPQGWQADAWDAFDEVPEIKESVWRLGNQMAKLRIYPAIVVDDDVVPVDDPLSGVPPEVAAAATQELARLKSLRGGQADILRKLEQNFIVVGECYVVGFAATTETRVNALGVTETVAVPEDWQVRSTDEVQNKDGVYTVKDPDQGEGQGRLLTDKDDIIRVWLEHPRFQVYADSLLRPLVVDARTVTSLTQQMYAESLSKHSAGAFLLPNELSFGPDDETEDEGGENAARDVFLEEFEASLLDPIDDPMSAAVVQPMLIRGPAELLDKVRWIPFGRETDAAIDDRINGRVERIARGLPEPVEKVMGHQQTTFANAAQVDADEFEDYLAPQADILMDALTYAYLRPQLADNPATQEWADRLVIGYDPSKLIANPNPADSADYGLEKGLISGEVWRRVNGYDEEDAPDPLELLVAAGLRRGILTADLTKALLELLGTPIEVEALPQAPPAEGTPPPGPAPGAALRRVLELMAAATPTLELPGDAPPRPQDGTSPGPGGSASPPQGGRRPGRGSDAGAQLAAIDRDLLARLTVAANDAMTRALERVGNQLRTKASANRALLLQVPRIEAARTLGPTLTAQALGETDPFAGAWDDLERQFMAWGQNAQSQALHIAGEVASGIDAASRDLLQLRQADDLSGAWGWLKERMSTLGGERLFSPNPLDPGIGEFDPTSKVPTGMLREAIARAGGAQGMAPAHDPALPGGSSSGGAWVALRNIDGTPSGGIGTGETLREGMLDGGAGIEGYRWVYGPAMRARPFEPHVELDGLEFVNFDDDALAVTGSFPDTGFYFPGDHAGCICDFEPIIIPGAEVGPGGEPVLEPDVVEPPPQGELGHHVPEELPAGTMTPKEADQAMKDRWADRVLPPSSDPVAQALRATPDVGYRLMDFARMDPKLVDDAARQLDQMMRDYPVTTETFKGLGTPSTVARHAYGDSSLANTMGPGTMGQASSLGRIELNPAYWKNGRGERVIEAHVRAAESGYFTPGALNDSGGYTVSHEFGHIIDFRARLVSREVSGVADELDLTGKTSRPNTANPYIREIADAVKRHAGDRQVSVSDLISRYASTDGYELIAEATADVYRSPVPDELSKELVAIARKWAENIPPERLTPGELADLLAAK